MLVNGETVQGRGPRVVAIDPKPWWYPYTEYVKHQAEHGTAPG